MDQGLTFKGNNNVTVTAESNVEGQNWYTIKETPDEGDTLTISFIDGIAEGTVITIKYKATINENALTKLENDAKVTYGDNYTTTESRTEVYNAEIGLVKYDGQNTIDTADDTLLAGAEFILAKDVAAEGSEGQEGYIEAHREYYKLDGTTVSWVTDIDQATVRTSTEEGTLDAKFTGLANGTYKLVEIKAPAGYNKAADIEITINSGDYTIQNLSQTKDILNNKGTELPSTGGMGTTIFYVLGSILVIGAAVLLITRRRMSAK